MRKKISRKDFGICAIILKKETIKNKEFSRTAVISRYLIDHLTGYSVYHAAKMAEDKDSRFKNNPFATPIILKIDRYQSKKYEQEFEKQLKNRHRRRFRQQPNIQIEHINSQEDMCLQLADLCAGSIFHKHEHGNAEYYDLLKDKIISEKEYFKNKE